MSVKYRLAKYKVLSGPDQGKEKFYARAKMSGTADLDKLSSLISSRSSLSPADIKSVLDSLNWAMDLELRAGNVVQLGEFGNFRFSVSSEGTETEKAFTAHKIKKAKIVFYPGASLRKSVRETTFEPDDVKVVEEECTKEHPM